MSFRERTHKRYAKKCNPYIAIPISWYQMGAYPMQKYYKIMIKQTFSLKNSRKIPTVSVILTTSKQATKNEM